MRFGAKRQMPAHAVIPANAGIQTPKALQTWISASIVGDAFRGNDNSIDGQRFAQ